MVAINEEKIEKVRTITRGAGRETGGVVSDRVSARISKIFKIKKSLFFNPPLASGFYFSKLSKLH